MLWVTGARGGVSVSVSACERDKWTDEQTCRDTHLYMIGEAPPTAMPVTILHASSCGYVLQRYVPTHPDSPSSTTAAKSLVRGS